MASSEPTDVLFTKVDKLSADLTTARLEHAELKGRVNAVENQVADISAQLHAIRAQDAQILQEITKINGFLAEKTGMFKGGWFVIAAVMSAGVAVGGLIAKFMH